MAALSTTTRAAGAAIVLMLAGCGEPTIRDRLARYEAAVAQAVRAPDARPTAATASTLLPDRRDRLLAVPEQRIGFFHFLSLQGCRLGELAGERMSAMGRHLEASRRLVHELAVLEGAWECLEEEDDVEQLGELLDVLHEKQRDLPAHVWNAVWTGPETEAFLGVGGAPSEASAVGALEDALHAARRAAESRRDGEDLEAALAALRRAPPIGPVLRELAAVESSLARAAALVAGAGKPDRCGKTEARLARAFRETWLAFTQGPVTALHARARDELPILEAIYASTRTALAGASVQEPAAMDAWQARVLATRTSAGLWPRLEETLALHVATWRPVLEVCEVLPAPTGR